MLLLCGIYDLTSLFILKQVLKNEKRYMCSVLFQISTVMYFTFKVCKTNFYHLNGWCRYKNSWDPDKNVSFSFYDITEWLQKNQFTMFWKLTDFINTPLRQIVVTDAFNLTCVHLIFVLDFAIEYVKTLFE